MHVVSVRESVMSWCYTDKAAQPEVCLGCIQVLTQSTMQIVKSYNHINSYCYCYCFT